MLMFYILKAEQTKTSINKDEEKENIKWNTNQKTNI